jgi:hypothetical protein
VTDFDHPLPSFELAAGSLEFQNMGLIRANASAQVLCGAASEKTGNSHEIRPSRMLRHVGC